MKSIESIRDIITATNPRSAWNKGVKEYALELLDDLEDTIAYTGETPCNASMLEKAMLNGARSWTEYSWGGCSLIYEGFIASRLCTATELKLTKNGQKRPNRSEMWHDVQARALHQASSLIVRYAEV